MPNEAMVGSKNFFNTESTEETQRSQRIYEIPCTRGFHQISYIKEKGADPDNAIRCYVGQYEKEQIKQG